MSDSSLITLNGPALKNNLDFLRQQYGPDVKLSSVLKANAYGHGIELMVSMLEEDGIDHFSVFDYSEAERVFNSASTSVTILIMGYLSDHELSLAIEKGMDFFVFTLNRLKRAGEIADEKGKLARIHIELETGMNRSGLNEDELHEAVSLIQRYPDRYYVAGLCTHLAGAESVSNHLRIKKQLETFFRLDDYLLSQNICPEQKHCANSAASFIYPESRLDMVRVGIMQYGFWSSTETYIYFLRNRHDRTDPLKRVLGWKSRVMSLKTVQVGEFVGYGISFLAQKETRIALVPVGYAQGYSRSLSNRGRVLIKGQRCSVIGLVNMNMLIADVTEVDDVNEGDEVVIIGKQGELEIKVSAFSDMTDSLNYEILAHLSESIPRKIIQ